MGAEYEVVDTKLGEVALRRWDEYSSSMFGTESMWKTQKRLGVSIVLLMAPGVETLTAEQIEAALDEIREAQN